MTYAEIFPLHNMQEMVSKVDEALKLYEAKDLLVAFDIDMTLTQPDHPATYIPAMYEHINEYKKIILDLDELKKDMCFMLTMFLPQRLVDEKTPQIIAALKEKDLKMIAFTSSCSGKIRNQPRLETFRYDVLKGLGIDFEDSFVDYPDLLFTEHEPYRGHYPSFYRGLLCANGERNFTSKGPVLLSFLRSVKREPKMIIMIDDRKKNLENIETFLKQSYPQTNFSGAFSLSISITRRSSSFNGYLFASESEVSSIN